jgi:hypothetical protein
MDEEMMMYADVIIAALKETKSVRIEVGSDDRIMYAHVTDYDGVEMCGFLFDMFEQVMGILVHMIHVGGNYNYRMEGNPEDMKNGKIVYLHVTNITN